MKDMINRKIPLIKTHVTEKDIEAVTNVMRRGMYLACGPEIEEFETGVEQFLGMGVRVLAFNSGTSALQVLLEAHNLKGCKVIVPSFTFIATANAVVLAGGVPVFADIEEETFGLDYESVKEILKNYRDIKAVIIMEYGGCPCRDLLKIKQLCDEKKVLLIEDAAQSFSATIGEQNVGTFGESSIFSLCQNKLLTTGEGGLLVTKNRSVYEKAKLLRSHGRVEAAVDYFDNTSDNDYIVAGYNMRMPSMCAAFGLSQLSNVHYVGGARRFFAEKLITGMKDLPIGLPKAPGEDFCHVYQMFTIKLRNKLTRDKLQEHLTKKGIMTKVYFQPIHLKTFYKKNFVRLPVTESVSDRVLTLPLYPDLKKEELDYIILSIKEFFKR